MTKETGSNGLIIIDASVSMA